ncbi:hypothetical protein KDW82_16035 [Burkholderia vietnamiensis]|nr:hypothetical protein [Burkholderia vietnamiensis]MBR8190551.1 hypothetical protein [Burkholderia vietnamiensis]
MSTSETERIGLGRLADGAFSDDSYSVPVKAGRSDERVIVLRRGESVTTILQVFSRERGCSIEELVLVREGEEEGLTEIVVDAQYPYRRRHHVHHSSAVAVTVYYQAHELRHDFKRHATVEDVLAWAIRAFNIDPSMAVEFELVLHGQKEELPSTEHIGHLAEHHDNLALDLVRGDIANGAFR